MAPDPKNDDIDSSWTDEPNAPNAPDAKAHEGGAEPALADAVPAVPFVEDGRA